MICEVLRTSRLSNKFKNLLSSEKILICYITHSGETKNVFPGPFRVPSLLEE